MPNCITFRLQTKITLAFALVLLIPTIVIGAYSTDRSTAALIAQEQAIDLADQRLESKAVADFLGRAKSDVLVLSQNDALKEYLGYVADGDTLSAQARLDAIQKTLLTFTQNVTMYDDVRFVDRTGQSVAQVRLVNGHAEIVANADLQNMAQEYYFKEALKLPMGQIYISRLGLDPGEGIEGATIHYTALVYTRDNRVGGAIIADVLAGSFLPLIGFYDTDHRIYLIDQDGTYLAGPDPSQLYGRDLNTGVNFFNDHPQDAPGILSRREGTLFATKEMPETLQTFTRISIPDQPGIQWIQYETDSASIIFDAVNHVRLVILLVAALSMLFAMAIAAFITNGIVKPVRRLSLAAAEISQGNWDTQIPPHKSRDEIGELTAAFGKMARELGTTIALQQRARELEIAKELAEEHSRLKSNFISLQ